MSLTVIVVHGRAQHRIAVDSHDTVQSLQEKVSAATLVPPELQRLVWSGKSLLAGLSPSASLADAGIRDGMKLLLVGSTQKDVDELAASQPQHRPPRDELKRGAPIARIVSTPVSHGWWRPPGRDDYGFESISVIEAFTTPPASEARKLLERLATDPGIVAVMRAHRWRVGVLSELEPRGKVGVSEVCLLGFNRNRGMEISLRIRTDDLRGFRYYDTIRRVLLHELTHMVYDDHGVAFNEFCSQLTKEATASDWTRSSGHALAGGSFADAPIADASSSAAASGHKLGGASTSIAELANSRERAAAAALSRLGTRVVPRASPPVARPVVPSAVSVAVASPAASAPVHVDLTAHLESTARPEHSQSMEVSDLRTEVDETQAEVKDTVATEPHTRADSAVTETHNAALPDGPVAMEVDDWDVTAVDGDTESLVRVRDMRQRLSDLLARLLQSDPAAFVTALGTLRTIIANAIEHPGDDKYRRIRASNAAFQARVGRYDDAVGFLALAGFARDGEGDLRLHRNDPGLLWLAVGVLDSFQAKHSRTVPGGVRMAPEAAHGRV